MDARLGQGTTVSASAVVRSTPEVESTTMPLPASGNTSRVLRLLGRGVLVATGGFGVSLLLSASPAGAAASTDSEPAEPAQVAVDATLASEQPSAGLDGVLSVGSVVLAPLNDLLAPVTEPIVDVVAPVLAPVTQPVANVAQAADVSAESSSGAVPALALLDPVTDLLAPVTEPIVDVVSPVLGSNAPGAADKTIGDLAARLAVLTRPLVAPTLEHVSTIAAGAGLPDLVKQPVRLIDSVLAPVAESNPLIASAASLLRFPRMWTQSGVESGVASIALPASPVAAAAPAHLAGAEPSAATVVPVGVAGLPHAAASSVAVAAARPEPSAVAGTAGTTAVAEPSATAAAPTLARTLGPAKSLDRPIAQLAPPAMAKSLHLSVAPISSPDATPLAVAPAQVGTSNSSASSSDGGPVHQAAALSHSHANTNSDYVTVAVENSSVLDGSFTRRTPTPE